MKYQVRTVLLLMALGIPTLGVANPSSDLEAEQKRFQEILKRVASEDFKSQNSDPQTPPPRQAALSATTPSPGVELSKIPHPVPRPVHSQNSVTPQATSTPATASGTPTSSAPEASLQTKQEAIRYNGCAASLTALLGNQALLHLVEQKLEMSNAFDLLSQSFVGEAEGFKLSTVGDQIQFTSLPDQKSRRVLGLCARDTTLDGKTEKRIYLKVASTNGSFDFIEINPIKLAAGAKPQFHILISGGDFQSEARSFTTQMMSSSEYATAGHQSMTAQNLRSSNTASQSYHQPARATSRKAAGLY